MGKQRRPKWSRNSSIGLEFAASIVGLSLLGAWIDHHFDSAPWGVLIGIGLGMVGGSYNLYRAASRWTRSWEKNNAAHSEEKETTEEKLDGDPTP